MFVEQSRSVLAILLVVSYPFESWSQGYTISDGAVVAKAEDIYRHWTVPAGTVELDHNEQIRLKPIRRDIDAVRDAEEFGGGIRSAGSNLKDAPNVMDGDSTTFWSPSFRNPLDRWWVDIDLGRLVFATRVRLRFVEEEIGDPFLKFKVLTAPSAKEILGRLDWKEVYRTESPNKDQRAFEFELSLKGVSFGCPVEEDAGDHIRFLRIMATESDGDRGRLVSEEEYHRLASDLKGAVEYFRIAATGKEEPISQEGYEKLSPEERGAIRYYRRERPGLAEVEVWTLGDNLSLGILQRGGEISYPRHQTVQVNHMVDGDILSYAPIYRIDPVIGDLGPILDLGGTFWVDTVIFATYEFYIPPDQRLRICDGTLNSQGEPVWDVVTPELHCKRTDYTMSRITDRFTLRRVHFLNVQQVAPDPLMGRMDIGELQIYGRGYPSEVTLRSPLIELGRARSLTTLSYEASAPPGTKVEIRTRTGDELREEKHYFDSGGREVTEQMYNSLPGFARGPIRTEQVPGSGWSEWSRPYLRSGDPVVSPSPRRYLQIEVKLLSEDPELCPSLRSLSVSFFTPLAKRITGRIVPDRIGRAGTPREFSWFVRPTFLSTDFGFDRILLISPLETKLELLSVRLGTEEAFSSGGARTLSPSEMEIVPTGPDSLCLHLSGAVSPGDTEQIEIRFRTIVYLNNTPFEGFIAHSAFPDWQRIDPAPHRQSMTVRTSVDRRIIGDVHIFPNPFTPNGDGVNDEVSIGFTVFKINVSKPVYVTIYRPEGDKVRELTERRPRAAGRYSIRWNGRDETGRVVSPGLYLCRIHIQADSYDAEDTATVEGIYVAY